MISVLSGVDLLLCLGLVARGMSLRITHLGRDETSWAMVEL